MQCINSLGLISVWLKKDDTLDCQVCVEIVTDIVKDLI